MKCEWETIAFGDLLEEPVRNGLTKPKAIRGTGVKMIAMGEIFAYSRIADVVTDRVPVTEKELQNCSIKPLDILFARQSLTLEGAGKCSIITNVLEDTVFESHLIRTRVNQRKADPFFLYYYFNSPHGKENIKSIVEQVAAAGIRGSDLVKLSVPYPCLEKQRKISAILRSLDDKIELNNKINENLQQQAQALYEYFFIQNADSEWKQGHLSDLVIVRYGKDHKKLADGVFPVFGSGGLMRKVERPLYDKESVLIPRKGTLNNVMYINEPFWSVDTMFYTEMKLPNVAKFVYHYVKSKDLTSMNAGSAVPSMTTDILNALELAIPNNEVLATFENLVSPLYSAMQHNIHESTKLAELRDSLLPKLMNGEVCI